jgi:hypothetical protein
MNIAVPATVNKIKEMKKLTQYTIANFFKEHNLHMLSPRTVYVWLNQLGAVYSASSKSYYIDSHERPENILYRYAFIKQYMSYEIHTH